MAMSAIGVEVCASALGQRSIRIVRLGQGGSWVGGGLGHDTGFLKLTGDCFTELLRREADDRAEALAMAELALGAAGKVPTQLAPASWHERIRNQQIDIATFAIRQFSVSSFFVPDKTVRLPKTVDELQHLCLQFLRLKLTAVWRIEHIHRDCLCQNGFVGESERSFEISQSRVIAWVQIDDPVTRDRDDARITGAVLPRHGIDCVGHDAGCGRELGQVRKQAGSTQLGWEWYGQSARRIRHKLIERAQVVDHDEFSIGTNAKTNDLVRGIGQFAVFGDLFAIVAQPPDSASGVVAVYVSASEASKPGTMVDVATSH